MLIKLNERFKKSFQDYIKSLVSHSSSYSGYQGYGGCYSPNYQSTSNSKVLPTSNTIYFYEWSDLNNKSIRFDSLKEFTKFCIENKIRICDYHETMIKESYYVYCTCIPGSPALMVRKTFNELKTALAAYQGSLHPSYSRPIQ